MNRYNFRRKAIGLVAFICFIFLLKSALTVDLYFINVGTFENVTCYFEFGDKLPFVDGRGFKPVPDSIFFHETSCNGGLNSRQACAVEAAARANPQWDVYVIFVGPVRNFDTKSLNALREFERVKLARIRLLEYAKDTPLSEMVAAGKLNRTRWRVSHTSDALRYLTLYKFGGVYLDLDTVVAKPLAGLGESWSARESDTAVAAGAMAFGRDAVGRRFADAAIRDLAENFRGDSWGHNGPGVITRVLQKKCNTRNVTGMSAAVCKGFEVYGPELFYPIKWEDALKYFEPGEISDQPYVFHAWNHVTQNNTVTTDSLYAKLAKRFCPSVYRAYGKDFGN